MLNHVTPCRLWLVLTAIFLLSPGLCAKSYAVPKGQLNKQLLDTVAKVRDGKTSNARTDAAERLATLTRGINPNKVNDATLTGMVSLLDTEEDSVRLWVAVALGNLGPRAKVAVPKLLKILPEVDCLRRSVTSAPAVRLALKRMGEKVPPEPNCEGKWH